VTDDAAAGPVVEDEELDGLSGERTDLAWSRSGLAFIVCLAAIAKRSLPQISTLDARAIVVVALVVGGIAWGFALVWARAVAGATLTGRRIGDARKLHWISIGTAVIGVVAVVVALFPDR
jgi:hypothetical protein